MLPAHKRFLFVEQGVGSIVVNLIINAVIAFLMFRGVATVPLWGEQSIAGDTVGTAFLLPLLTCLIVTPLVRRQVRAGAVAPLAAMPASVQWMPRRAFWRGGALGLIGALAVAPVAITSLTLLGVTHQSFWGFVTFKAMFAAALGAVVSPLIALWAIAEDAQRPAPLPTPEGAVT